MDLIQPSVLILYYSIQKADDFRFYFPRFPLLFVNWRQHSIPDLCLVLSIFFVLIHHKGNWKLWNNFFDFILNS